MNVIDTFENISTKKYNDGIIDYYMNVSRHIHRELKLISNEYRHGLWYIARRFRKFQKSVTVHTKQGIFNLSTEIDDPISRSLFLYREFELDLITSAMILIRDIRQIPKGKGIILDIGANNGVISIGMLVRGEAEKAIAIEPDPRNFAALKHNVAQNHLKNAITCLNYAVSDKKSILQFELSETNYGDHRIRRSTADTGLMELYKESERHVIDVEANTLDDIFTSDCKNNNFTAIWIDVQGHEGYVFKGAERLLSKGIPVVSEIWPYGIRRAGMAEEEFCSIIKDIWPSYWVKRRGRFIRYSTNIFYSYLEELGCDGDFDNVIFTK